MDNLAPIPTQRPFDDVGRTPEQTFRARKKAMKKVQPVPVNNQDADPEIAPDTDTEPESDHHLDLLA